MNNIKYYLVLEKRLGDYFVIDINKLDIASYYVGNALSNIDAFTIKYSENELKESIKRSNMTSDNYIDGKFKVISDVRHNLNVIFKEDYEIIRDFQMNNDDINVNLKNKLYGYYKKQVEKEFDDQGFINRLLDLFKNALRTKDKKEIFGLLEEFPYSKVRQAYIYISEGIKEQRLVNKRRLEKTNE